MSLVISPRVSEKSYDLATNVNTYVFLVPLSANKIEIKKQVEAEYSVNVLAVNIVRQDGKRKAAIKGKRQRPGVGKRTDYKKAFVKLAAGQSLPVFAAQEGEDK
ncbi:50S ribosomal protein L23 [Candidatus Nomurabacteria bacterium]|jgi:large subunit ribosomal protein L23|nr:50S ribosomal protein L23 [Candidatus Saccharibacteria bacterium]MCB9839854.1 50S ribosomal protein L23 [Candidatus Nomurabacteria bacterium]